MEKHHDGPQQQPLNLVFSNDREEVFSHKEKLKESLRIFRLSFGNVVMGFIKYYTLFDIKLLSLKQK